MLAMVLALLASTGLPALAAGSGVGTLQTIAVDSGPWGVAITPDGSTALVANNNSSTVSVLSKSGGGWTMSSTINAGQYPIGLAVAPNGQSALIVSNGSNSVSVLVKAGSTWRASGEAIEVGDHPLEVAISPDGTTALVSNNYDGTLTELSAQNGGGWTVSGTVKVGTAPIGIAYAPDSNHVLVATKGDNQVVALTRNGSTWKVAQSIASGAGPWDVAISPDGASALVTSYVDGTVTALSWSGTQWSAVGAPIVLGPTDNPMEVAITPDSGTAFVANNSANTVTTLTRSGTTWAAGDSTTVGNEPTDVAISPDGSTALITNNGDNTVSALQLSPVLSPASQTVAGSIGVPLQTAPLSPTGVATPFTYKLGSGASLPAGLNFDSSTGVISGTPTEALPQTVYTITGTDGSHTQTATVQLSVSLVFTDVPVGTQFHDEITWLADQGVTTGWPQSDGTHLFLPLDNVHRDAMAAFLYRLDGSPDYTAPATSPFSDVHPGDDYYKEICWLASKGITTGYPDGSYRPLDDVNRDAMAAFLYRFDGSPTFTPPSSTPFSDVQSDNQFYKEITWLSTQGISTGWPDGTYRPVTPVARDAMAAFMYRLVHPN